MGYGAVGFSAVPELYQPIQPFQDIEQIEGKVKQFLHLRRMYGFVIEVGRGHDTTFPDEKDSKDVDTLEAPERDEAVVYYFHSAPPSSCARSPSMKAGVPW